MNRRALLERVGALAAAGAVAGCLDEGGTDGGDPGAGGDDGNGGDENGSSDDGADGGEGGNGAGEDDTGSGEDGNDADDDATDENATDGDADDCETEVTVVSRSIETLEAECTDGGGVAVGNETSVDEGDPDATVEFDGDRVVVVGHLGAPTPCHEATLEDVDVEEGAVGVAVGLESTLGPDEFCMECLGRIDYEATLEFDGAVDEVTVTHRTREGRTEVASESR